MMTTNLLTKTDNDNNSAWIEWIRLLLQSKELSIEDELSLSDSSAYAYRVVRVLGEFIGTKQALEPNHLKDRSGCIPRAER